MGNFPEILSLNRLLLKLNQFKGDFAAGFPHSIDVQTCTEGAQGLTFAVEKDLLIIILLFQTALPANFQTFYHQE